MSDFYVDTIGKLIDKKVLRREMKILVVCGGEWDKNVLLECGFENVVISNLDTRMDADDYAPFQWSFQDAEALDFDDNQFDICIAHSGLHHCQSPHGALLEMYRVARLGLIVFEPADNLATRLGVRLGLGQQYEVAAVVGNGLQFGGLKNTPIPNYIYRWTEREVEKTIQSYAPIGQHDYMYFYKLRLPWYRSRMMKSRLLDLVFLLTVPLAWLFTRVLPRECNNCAFVVLKPELPAGLHPWLSEEDGSIHLNPGWIESRYQLNSEA